MHAVSLNKLIFRLEKTQEHSEKYKTFNKLVYSDLRTGLIDNLIHDLIYISLSKTINFTIMPVFISKRTCLVPASKVQSEEKILKFVH
jgi:predicted choloylglycine hydrolase